MAIILYENFEGVGQPSGWFVNIGTPDWDYSPALHGNKSARFGDGATREAARYEFTDRSEIWIRFMFMPKAFSWYDTVVRFENVATAVFHLKLFPSGDQRYQLQLDSVLQTSTNTMSIDTLYYLWFHYINNGAGNQQIDFYLSTDGKRPLSPELSISGGTSGLDVNRITFDNASTDNIFLIDELTMSDEALGDFIFGDGKFNRFNHFKGF